MYWVWGNEPASPGEARIYGPPAVAEDLNVEFDAGFIVAASVPLVELVRDDGGAGVLGDSVALRGGGGLLFSSRLRQVLAEIGIDNIQYFPALIRNRVDGSQTGDHQIANIVGVVSCLDRQNAQVEVSPEDPEVIEFIEVLAIDEAKARGADLFRLHEDRQVVIASERVKETCERHRITGVRFFDPREYEF